MSILATHLKPLHLRVIHGAFTIFPHHFAEFHDPFWWLWWLTDEGAWIDHPRGRLQVPPRQVVLLPAGGTFTVGARGRPRLLWMKLDLPLLAAGLAAHGPILPQVLAGDALLDGLAERADRGRRGATPPGWAEAFAWAAVASWIEQLDPVQREGLHDAQGQLAPLQPFLRLVDEHLADPLPVAVLATACGCSPATLARLVRHHLQTTPSAWIRHRRCMRAAELLSTSALSIDDIARRCGFANRYLLTRHFTVVSGGVPPARYRLQTTAAR